MKEKRYNTKTIHIEERERARRQWQQQPRVHPLDSPHSTHGPEDLPPLPAMETPTVDVEAEPEPTAPATKSPVPPIGALAALSMGVTPLTAPTVDLGTMFPLYFSREELVKDFSSQSLPPFSPPSSAGWTQTAPPWVPKPHHHINNLRGLHRHPPKRRRWTMLEPTRWIESMTQGYELEKRNEE